MKFNVVKLVAALTLGLFAAPLAVEAQQPGKVYRVGILTNKASDPAEARLWQAFRLGLRELGWIEGENILIEPGKPRATSLGSQNSRPTWFGSRWT